MSDGHETDKNIEIWKIKKLIKALEAARGNGTSMISLIMPPRDQISRVTKMLGDEFGTASNIKSRVNRQSVLGAITSAQQRLKLYNKVPPNGLVLYTGTIVTEDGKEKKVTIDFEPFRPINASLYLCDNKFHTEALSELLESDDKFGFIVMDGNGTLFGTLSGNTREEDLHHDIFFFLILILVFVLWILVGALWHFHYKKNPIPQRIVHGTTIEILWTIFPSLILMFIAIPSFALLYAMDEVVVDPAITMKAIGHQWYWTYEYSDYNSSDEESLTFDSYMIPEDDLELGQLRLLEVDNRLVVPANSHLRLLVTSADVLHSWAVPSLGVKCDAVPGRLNQISILVQREGVYYGQCSEICGTNHAFMPIVVEALSLKDYCDWVDIQQF